ncbi:MAG: hypothetical protein ABJA18_00785 [bacterium]
MPLLIMAASNGLAVNKHGDCVFQKAEPVTRSSLPMRNADNDRSCDSDANGDLLAFKDGYPLASLRSVQHSADKRNLEAAVLGISEKPVRVETSYFCAMRIRQILAACCQSRGLSPDWRTA